VERISSLQEQIAAEAAQWFARLRESDAGRGTEADFVEWLLRSPEHLEEFLAVSRVWGETQVASPTLFCTDDLIDAALAEPTPANVVALKGTTTPLTEISARRRKPLRYQIAAAAAALLALGSVIWLVVERSSNSTRIITAIGEQRSVTLADGSVLDVNTNSEVRIDLAGAERHLQLVHGEARFKVTRNPQRPFIVSTPQATIRVLGTIFNVRAEMQNTAVAVLEGQVDVREVTQLEVPPSGITHIELKAGQLAAVNPAGHIVPNAGPPLERVAAWTERRLVFREEPLSVVVAELNRYQRKPIRIDAPQLADLRISGTFDSSDPGSFLEYFQRFEHVRVERDGDSVRLVAPAP